jgi:hypothetical protein
MGGQARSTNPAGVWVAMVVVTLIVAGLAGIAVFTYSRARPLTSTGSQPDILSMPLRISVAATGLRCPTDPTFSRDGTSVAVVGVLGACDTSTGLPSGASPHALAIFDARTGTRTEQVPLEPLLGLRRGAQPATVRFASLGWSPDGSHIALIFTAFDSAIHLTADHLLDEGLLVLSTRGGTPVIITGDTGYFPILGGEPSGFPVWLLDSGSELSAPSIAAGLDYSWGQGGVPEPVVPVTGVVADLPIDAGPKYPVGDPDGDPSYTIWQPGLMVGPNRAPVLGGGRAIFLTAFPTWSPDGTHVTLLTAGIALTAPVNHTSAPPGGDLTDGPLPLPTPPAVSQAPDRDPALNAIEQEVGGDGSALVAWNPSGGTLASIACETGMSAGSLVLRNTASGAVLGSAVLEPSATGCGALPASPTEGSYPDQPVALLWSPIGHSLLVCDRAAGIVSLWSVGE